MNGKKYSEDLKNLKPKGLDMIPAKNKQISIKDRTKSMVNVNNQTDKEVIKMEPLNNSKTMWGFGIAVLIFIIQQVLSVMNIAGPDNLLLKAGIEVIIAVAGFFGVYGIRDALRKMKG